MVGERIKFARQEAGLTQAELAQQLDFKDRQILANIEGGKRKVAADELVKLMEIFKKPMDFFTDALLLVGEGAVSWRAQNVPKLLDEYEAKVRPLVALYRFLGPTEGEPEIALVSQLPLSPKSSFEEASLAASRLAADWNLGAVPARTMVARAEEKLPLLVLMMDMPREISGAAVHLTSVDTIVINRNDPEGRRNYDFAHELFHLLTWQSMPPAPIDEEQAKGTKAKRVEQLAESFAATFLMPEATVKQAWETRGDREIHEWLNGTAAMLGVSAKALYWRARHLELLTSGDAMEVRQERLTWNGAEGPDARKPKLYSRRFMERLHRGLDKGYVSVRRAAALLDTSVAGLRELFEQYGMEAPFDL
jgi:Zn-dependent peptidase ImmA (M78 family)/transcriptional regulator with XRE-family HTH domain